MCCEATSQVRRIPNQFQLHDKSVAAERWPSRARGGFHPGEFGPLTNRFEAPAERPNHAR